jgi:hypothetical protein
MIKIGELRLGNLVKYNGLIMEVSEICSPKPLKDKRYSDKYVLELFDGYGLITCTLDEIEPVIITEEQLLYSNFTFKPEGDEVYEQIWKHLEGLEIWEHDEGFCHDYLFGGDIKYLHKLQNLFFALMDKEMVFEKK